MFSEFFFFFTQWYWQLKTALGYYLQGTYTGSILADFIDLFAQLWYFVALGALISTLVWRYLPKEKTRRLLERRVNASIVGASLLGLVSPMCTFAAIPIVGNLIAMGLSPAPLLAFIVASPLMNPALFLYTAGTISLEMALARTFTALGTGLLGGFAAQWVFKHRSYGLSELKLNAAPDALYHPVAGGADLSWREELAILARRYRTDLQFIAKFFSLGLLIAALVKNLLSESLVLSLLGPGNPWAVPTAVALGVPLYACGGGSIPIIETMMRLGMSSGAALGFFIAGPATKFATLSVFGAVFGRRLLGFYLAVVLSSALFWGYLYPFDSQGIEIKGTGGASYEELIGE